LSSPTFQLTLSKRGTRNPPGTLFKGFRKITMFNATRRAALIKALIGSSLLFGAVITTSPARAAEAPDALIKRLSTEALERISKDPELAAGDIKKINAMIDQVVMPSVNFQRMTALAVGRSWRSATPEQQKQLMTEFRALLVRSYANAFALAKDRTVRLKPLRMEPADTEVTVYSELVPKRGEATPVGYRLEKTGDTWKAYDVNVLGVWLVDNYRNQFSQEINAKGIDGLIKALAEKNKG
jgi:phospholipid transport system substrate-binding protein